jgi:hypothetical protein
MINRDGRGRANEQQPAANSSRRFSGTLSHQERRKRRIDLGRVKMSSPSEASVHPTDARLRNDRAWRPGEK